MKNYLKSWCWSSFLLIIFQNLIAQNVASFTESTVLGQILGEIVNIFQRYMKEGNISNYMGVEKKSEYATIRNLNFLLNNIT